MVLRRQSLRALEQLRSSDTGLLALALVVGAGAGLGAIAFRWLIVTFTLVLSGHRDYAAVPGADNPHVPWLGPFFVVAAPVVAGLVYGPLVYRFAPEARGHGVPEVMFAVARRGGRIAPQVAGVKALASALCIGGGGSVGREGPIVQIGAALGSTLAGIVRVPESRRRVLVACGSAGGIAATFNAPLAGVFFAMELILVDFAAQSFGMVVLAAVTASVIGRSALGNAPFLDLPTFQVHHVTQYLLFAGLGVVAGAVGVGFTKALYAIEDVCDWAWRGPEWLRPAVGGLVLGLLLLVLPQMYGVGYPVLSRSVAGHYTVLFLLVLLVGKVVATSLTIGIGGSGGVFAPSLFVGAVLGSAVGELVVGTPWGGEGAVGTCALIGMGAVFAGAARAPITAVVILFELTGEYSIILPLMVAIVLATGVSHVLSADTVYSLKLRRRGVDLAEPASAAVLRRTSVAEVMAPPGPLVHQDVPVTSLVTAFEDAAHHGRLAVVDDEDRYVGTMDARTLAEALSDAGGETGGEPGSRTRARPQRARDLVDYPPTVGPDSPLGDAFDALERADVPGIPVVGPGSRLVGWVTARDVVRSLHPPSPPSPR